MGGTRRKNSAPSLSLVPRYVLTRSLSIGDTSYHPGDRYVAAALSVGNTRRRAQERIAAANWTRASSADAFRSTTGAG